MIYYWFISNGEEYYYTIDKSFRLVFRSNCLFRKIQQNNDWEETLIAENVTEFEMRIQED